MNKTKIPKVTVLDTRKDWIAVFVEDRLHWQGHPDSFDWVHFMANTLGLDASTKTHELTTSHFQGDEIIEH